MTKHGQRRLRCRFASRLACELWPRREDGRLQALSGGWVGERGVHGIAQSLWHERAAALGQVDWPTWANVSEATRGGALAVPGNRQGEI